MCISKLRFALVHLDANIPITGRMASRRSIGSADIVAGGESASCSVSTDATKDWNRATSSIQLFNRSSVKSHTLSKNSAICDLPVLIEARSSWTTSSYKILTEPLLSRQLFAKGIQGL